MQRKSILPYLHVALLFLSLSPPSSFSQARRPGTVIAWGSMPPAPPITNAIAVSIRSGVLGGPNVVALLNDGKIVHWGNNTASVPADLTNAIAVAAGAAHSVALRSDGTVVSWGRWPHLNTPPAGLSNVVAVAAGWDITLALLNDGTVRGWGHYGAPADLTNVVAIACGVDHQLALKSDGTVVAWGGVNQWGQASVPSWLTNVVAISAGRTHNLALRNDGRVVFWGFGSSGEVLDLLTNVTAIAAGGFKNAALLPDGRMIGWDSIGPELFSDHTNLVAIAAGDEATLAITLQPVFTEHPLNQRLYAGEHASFSVAAVSGSPVRYQWQHNGLDIENATNSTLQILNAQARHNGKYRALASNDDGVTFSSEAELEVQPSGPRGTNNVSLIPIIAGSELVLDIGAFGSEPMQFQWWRNGFPFAGGTNAVLRIENVQDDHEGRYFLTLTNAYGSARTHEITVIVNYPPSIANTLTEIVAPAGTNLILRAFVDGNPPLFYQWQLDGSPLETATNASLVLPNVQAANAGEYSIIASNAFGTITNIVFRVATVDSPPVIYASPQSQQSQIGDRIAFKVAAGGSEPLSYQWWHNGIPIPAATNPLLILDDLALSNAGEYYASVTNLLGATNSPSATLSLGERFPGEIDWPSIRLTEIVTNRFALVTGIAAAPGDTGRLYILEQGGRIHIVSNQTVSIDFLDLTTNVLGGPERGLLGIAFSPGFATNRTFYLNYTRRPDGATVISRFKAAPDAITADPASEEILKVIPQPAANHNGGQMAFGPEGYLYIGMGDGGAGAGQNAQDPASLLGKMLRIDVESGVTPYGIPPTNPFLTNSAYQPEIWALGLRNPWRFSFDLATGDLFIADVGERRFEEVNFQPGGSGAGANYGWPLFEGNSRMPGRPATNLFEAPVIDYPRQEGGSITGGYVYRGSQYPRMNGVYFFADFLSGRIWALKASGTNWNRAELLRVQRSISTFGQGADGALYLAEYGPQGRILRLEDSGQAAPPSFDKPSGILFSNRVTVSSSTPGAAIHYTTDGRDPTEFDPSVQSGSIISITTGQVKARAFRVDLEPSEVTAANYTLKVGPPQLSIAPGAVIRGTTLSITNATEESVIHYTLDGSAPDRSAPVYSGPIQITNDVVLAAQAYRDGFLDSDPAGGTFSIAAVDIPQFNPLVETITNGTPIEITTPIEGAIIYYSTNGADPDLESVRYDGPVRLNGKTTLKAIAFHSDYKPSPIASHFYELIYVETLQFTPAEGPVTNNTAIHITSTTSDAAIRYTLDGSEPDETSILYTTPVRITESSTLTARAFKDQHNPSSIHSARFNLIYPEATVVWTLAGGTERGMTNGPGHLARFHDPHCLWRDPNSGVLYVSDSGNHMIRKILPNGEVSTVAGTGSPGYVEGELSVAQFGYPTGIAADPAGNIFVADRDNGHRIRIITPDGNVDTYAAVWDERYGPGLWQMEMDSSGNLYVGNQSILTKVAAESREISHIAGWPYTGEFALWLPVAVGPDDSIFTAAIHRIVQIVPSAEPLTIAGSAAGFADGPSTNALFNSPREIAADPAGNLYVSEWSRIRKITPAGHVSTLAGNGQTGFRDGPGSQAEFNAVTGLAIDSMGNVYVADTLNHRIRVVSPDIDADAIPDFKETAPLVVGVDDRAVDSDNDGISNASEYLAGTDAGSVFRIEEVQVTGGRVTLKWRSVAGKNYRVERSENLHSWSTVTTTFQGDGSIITYTDEVPAANSPARAYRITMSAE